MDVDLQTCDSCFKSEKLWVCAKCQKVPPCRRVLRLVCSASSEFRNRLFLRKKKEAPGQQDSPWTEERKQRILGAGPVSGAAFWFYWLRVTPASRCLAPTGQRVCRRLSEGGLVASHRVQHVDSLKLKALASVLSLEVRFGSQSSPKVTKKLMF